MGLSRGVGLGLRFALIEGAKLGVKGDSLSWLWVDSIEGTVRPAMSVSEVYEWWWSEDGGGMIMALQ